MNIDSEDFIDIYDCTAEMLVDSVSEVKKEELIS